jgi:hypothetical protein
VSPPTVLPAAIPILSSSATASVHSFETAIPIHSSSVSTRSFETALSIS